RRRRRPARCGVLRPRVDARRHRARDLRPRHRGARRPDEVQAPRLGRRPRRRRHRLDRLLTGRRGPPGRGGISVGKHRGNGGHHPVAATCFGLAAPMRLRCGRIPSFSRKVVGPPMTGIPADDVRYQSLSDLDPAVAEAMAGELARQRDTLEMIASENFVPRAVLQAQGSVLTNKYAEGYPGRRYYGGCENVDIVEDLARDRAKELFGAEFANVQPHAGAQANAAVLHALINAGDRILGLDLAHGGHLTHGMKLNFSGKLYEVGAYGVDPDTMRVDMDKVREQALAEKPDVIIAGWSAFPRHLDFDAFRSIADEVGAKLWTDMAHFAGLVAAGLHPSPVAASDVVSTTVHKTLGGPRSGMILVKQDYAKKLNSAVFPGQQGGPLMHAIAAKAVALKIAATEQFKERQERTLTGARLLAERLTASD